MITEPLAEHNIVRQTLQLRQVHPRQPDRCFEVLLMTVRRLGVRLRKPGVYALNVAARSPGPADVQLALRVASRAAWTAVGFAMLVVWLRLR